MRAHGHRSIRSWLALTAAAAAAASGLAAVSTTSGAASFVDKITVIPDSGTPIGVEEGTRTSPEIAKPHTATQLGPSNLVGKFTDSGNVAGGAPDCNASLYTAQIGWGDGSSSFGSVSCEAVVVDQLRVFDVIGGHTYADSNSYSISVTVVDTDESENSGAVKTDTAAISDSTLGVDFDNAEEAGAFTKAEGAGITVGVAFFDNNNSFPNNEAFDPSLTATIDWGDGGAAQSVTPLAPPASCDCVGDFLVTATHVYDARSGDSSTYHIAVTAKDDGGQTATDTFIATIRDGKLTAGTPKTITATATQATSPVVASFTDAAGAQATVADFTASIKWGDNSTSTGTVTKTAAGAFDVSGSHTYATAGSKSLTITVTDEEGQTVSLTATATVGAAPVVLPLTGQPTAPVAPWSMLALIGAVLGVLAIAGGIGPILIRKARH